MGVFLSAPVPGGNGDGESTTTSAVELILVIEQSLDNDATQDEADEGCADQDDQVPVLTACGGVRCAVDIFHDHSSPEPFDEAFVMHYLLVRE